MTLELRLMLRGVERSLLRTAMKGVVPSRQDDTSLILKFLRGKINA